MRARRDALIARLVRWWVVLRALVARSAVETDAVAPPPAPEPEVVAPPPPAPEPEPERAPRRPRLPRAVAADEPGGFADADDALRWDVRATILDRLDEYFACMQRLRRADPPAYRAFSRIGFAVMPDLYARPADALSGPRPTLGGILLPKGGMEHPESRDKVYPSFLYYRKIVHPFAVQLWHGDVYELTLLYDDRYRSPEWRSDFAGVARCYIGLDAGGAMTLLRERLLQTIEVPDTRARGRGQYARSRTIAVRRQAWQSPPWVADVAEDTQFPGDVSAWAGDMLTMVLRSHRTALDRIVVRAKRASCVAAFGIDLSCAPRFFRDRDTTALARDGRRKRIFHFVRKHPRQLPDGRVVDVREHYRGSRSFAWNGNDIHIVLPKNVDVLHIDVPTLDAMTMTDEERRASVPEYKVADLIAEVAER